MKIICRDVSFSYGEKQILRGLNFTLQPGSRTALMGPSGCGKTTLLRLLAGLERPDTGSIAGLPPEGVAMVFQENRLVGQLTLLDNLSLVAPRRPARELETRLLELGLGEEAGRYPAELSGGMKRRAAIARAAAFQSPLMLLDEPFTGLDEQNRERAARFLLHHARDRVLFAVTHDPAEARLLDAQILQMRDLGRNDEK